MTRRCRNAVYWAAPDRTYALSRRETPEQAKCPKCGNVLSLEPFTRSEKIYICGNPECKWKIQKSKVVTKVNIKIGSEIHPLDRKDGEFLGMELPENNYHRKVYDCLVRILEDVGCVSEKDFAGVEAAMKEADLMVRNLVAEECIVRMGDSNARPEMCAEVIYWKLMVGAGKVASDGPIVLRIARDLVADTGPMASEKMTALYVKFHSWATKLAMSRPSGAPITTQIIDGMANVSNKIRGKEGLTGRAAVEAIVEAMKDDFNMESQPIMSLAKKYGYSTIRKMFYGY